MPLIQPTKKLKDEILKVPCPASLLTEIQQYCAAFDVEKPETFFMQAAQYVLQQDKDWRRFKKSSDRPLSDQSP